MGGDAVTHPHPGLPLERGTVYMTKTTAHNYYRQAGSGKRSYFERFFVFALGVCGAGGLASIFRSIASARFFVSAGERNSTSAITAARSDAVGGFFMDGA